MKRSQEAFWWSLFSAGGVMSALFMPAIVIVTGLLLPFVAGEDGYSRVHQTISFWPARAVLFVVIVLSMFHCAHRIRHILLDIGLHSVSTTLSVGSYGAAFVGTAVAAFFLSTM